MPTEKDNIIQIKRLSSDSSYYTSVFKRTEKIVSVIFYILSETKTNTKTEPHIEIIKDRAFKTHELSLQTLSLQPHEQTAGLLNFQYALVSLESTLRVARTAGVISPEIFNLLLEPLDAVLRHLNHHYLKPHGPTVEELGLSISEGGQPAEAKPRPQREPNRQRRVNIPAGDISSDAYLVYSQLTDRAERIKTVLEAKPQATIKDISEIITDVSEKTIQRELNSLIEKGQVTREGERRWSRYSVAK
jgi:DNA-binding transcriptional ArsR family regulator